MDQQATRADEPHYEYVYIYGDDDDPRPGREDGRGGYRRASDETWALARRDYLAGDSAEAVCDRYDLREGTLRHRAAAEGWRRRDQPDPEPVDLEAELAAGLPDYADMARHALVRLNRAVLAGRSTEAARWMRLHERLLTLAQAEQDRAEKAAAAQPKPEPRLTLVERKARLDRHTLSLGRAMSGLDPAEPSNRLLAKLAAECLVGLARLEEGDDSDDSDPVSQTSADASPSPSGEGGA
ncbi:hypothetical protein ACFPIF_12750 [Brevundimonas faecalis]|uniref:hypothetical protein n=1 Tax=Brevundimonas faecalis TaxID=947378 RepID=UPI0036079F03